ncbi:AroM family protein [Metasolibacillus meyeri]|uniref:AroM family protein n=1 Tax=Metasolibacillus meyeri TaxID=1071052 RepID=UPI000D313BD3|nr:AroM family protein [Metasolibacillus meyeri]
MKNAKIAVVTIGQAPRKDMASDIVKLKDAGLDITEFGVLDLLTLDEINTLAPTPSDDDILVTLLTSGKQVKLSKQKLMPYIQKRMHDLSNFQWILLMCTGDFANKLTGKNVLLPDHFMTHLIKGIHPHLHLGLIGPEPEQQNSVCDKWQRAQFNVSFAASSPYHFNEQHLLMAAQKLAARGADLLILDCMGYSNSIKKMIQDKLNIPVVVPRDALFTLIKDVL